MSYNNNNNRGDRRNSGGSRSNGATQMHDATCGDCGKNCKVPFMPSSGKPVYCSDCFEKRGNGRDNRDNNKRGSFSSNRGRDFSPRASKPSVDFAKEISILNTKLDNILRILDKQE